MKLIFTVNTGDFFTRRARKLFDIIWGLKNSRTAWSRTKMRLLILFDIVLKLKFRILFLCFRLNKILDLLYVYLIRTFRTVNRKFLIQNSMFKVLIEASFMKFMSTRKRADCEDRNLFIAD